MVLDIDWSILKESHRSGLSSTIRSWTIFRKFFFPSAKSIEDVTTGGDSNEEMTDDDKPFLDCSYSDGKKGE